MYVQIVSNDVAESVRQILESDGFRMGTAPYASWEAVGSDVRATFYTRRRKLLFQGAGADGLARRLAGVLPEQAAAATGDGGKNADARIDEPTIGSDETGKGDYFGSLVVAGCLARPEDVAYLRECGVRDSKQIADSTIMILEGKILDRVQCEVVELEPPEYGRLHAQTKNVNVILGEAHAEVIRKLKLANPDCKRAVVDKFGRDDQVLGPLGDVADGMKIKLMPRAEANPAVAAASIVARAVFVRSLARLSDQCGVDLLPGASAQVEEVAHKVAAVGGRELLSTVAKMHFKTTERILPGERGASTETDEPYEPYEPCDEP